MDKYYMIIDKDTTKFMPQSNRGKGFTADEPTTRGIPRLFTTKRAAQNAITWWKKGQTEVWRDYQDGDENWTTTPCAHRDNITLIPLEVRIIVA